jgi:hypothetical protein
MSTPQQPAGLKVQDKQCATCIYRPASGFDVKVLEAQIADPHLPGFFSGFRVCHHAGDRSQVCCRGFWNRHKDHFTLGQLAQRLTAVIFVHVNRFKDR